MAIHACESLSFTSRSSLPHFYVGQVLTRNLVGGLFSDRRDQEHMLAILRRTEHDHGRPTARVQAEMVHSVWHWADPPEDLVKQETYKTEGLIRTN